MDTKGGYTNEELVNGLKSKDSAIVNWVYRNNYKSVRHLVTTNSGGGSEADDIFQETMIVLYRKVREDGFKLTCNLSTYIYSIARLLWLKELESKRKLFIDLKDIDDNGLVDKKDILNTIEYSERQKLYRRKFDELSEDCKKVLRLFFNGLAIKEITKIMGYSTDQHTKNRRFRCKKSLISRIQETTEFKELMHGNN